MNELSKFYRLNYSSNRMNVALVSNHSIVELEKMATTHFGDIIDKGYMERDFTKSVIFDADNSFQRIFKVIPGSQIK